jgi:hypothetical protein
VSEPSLLLIHKEREMPHHTHHRSVGGRRTVAAGTTAALTALATVVALGLAPATVAGAAAAATKSQPGGASGTVAALTPTSSSMEVQNPSSGQTTVTWNSTTAFSKVVSELVSIVTPGDCLTVTGTASKKSKTTIAARSVTITTAPASGTCGAAGNGRGFLGTGGGAATGARGGFPGGSGRSLQFNGGGGTSTNGGQRARPPAALANLAVASGKVTVVSNGTVTLSGYLLSGLFSPRAAPAKNSSKSTSKSAKTQKKPPTPKKQTLKITTSKSTTLTETQTVTSAALAIGQCVTAFGQASSTGAVTASRVSITPPSSGTTCNAGVGARFGGGPGGFGGPPPGAGA